MSYPERPTNLSQAAVDDILEVLARHGVKGRLLKVVIGGAGDSEQVPQDPPSDCFGEVNGLCVALPCDDPRATGCSIEKKGPPRDGTE